MSKMDAWLAVPQPKLGAVGLLVLLVMGSLVAPLSLDMYTPAIPGMAAYFDTTPEIVNLTLVGYYLFMALGLLVFGPLSDKYGRKPVLVLGMGSYFVFSALCAVAVNIEMLVVARLVQALGSGAMSSVCTAIVKDAVQDQHREKMLSIMQIMFVIGPVASPIIGAGILMFTNWRGTFWALTIIGLIETIMALMYQETLPAKDRLDVSIPKTLGRLLVVGRNGAFMTFLLISSAWELGYMGVVSVGAYIYCDMFGFPPMGFSLFFAAATLMCAVGPAAWLRLSGHVTIKRFTTIAVVSSVAVGVLTLLFGHISAYVFCAFFLVFTFFESAVRPFAVNVLLSQQDSDTGSAAALINFVRVITGVVGMFAVVLTFFGDYIFAVGWMMAGGMGLAFVAWLLLLRSRSILKGVKDTEEPVSLL